MTDSAATDDLLVYLNGQFLPRGQAMLSVEDRGTMFGDGVYEVLNYHGGTAHAVEAHMMRLRRSLAGLRLDEPPAVPRLPAISDELVRRNGLADARIYWQITRGPAPRNHLLPPQPRPTVLAICDPAPPLDPTAQPRCLKAVTHDDLRWACCWIKSLMLLPNTLAKDRAHHAGCQEALLHRAGVITEGASTNVFIVADGVLWTHPADQSILAGVTRAIVLDLAAAMKLPIREKPFTVEQARAADEVFITGTTTRVAAITHVDGQTIGAGACGPVTRALHDAYLNELLTSANEGVRQVDAELQR